MAGPALSVLWSDATSGVASETVKQGSVILELISLMLFIFADIEDAPAEPSYVPPSGRPTWLSTTLNLSIADAVMAKIFQLLPATHPEHRSTLTSALRRATEAHLLERLAASGGLGEVTSTIAAEAARLGAHGHPEHYGAAFEYGYRVGRLVEAAATGEPELARTCADGAASMVPGSLLLSDSLLLREFPSAMLACCAATGR